MTALSDALTAAQARALAALARQYVRGPQNGDDEAARADLRAIVATLGLDDRVEADQWIACLDVLRATGDKPPEANGQRPYTERRESEPATDAQWQLIRRMCDERTAAAPYGPLTKAQASTVIDELRAGSYDADKWSVPF